MKMDILLESFKNTICIMLNLASIATAIFLAIINLKLTDEIKEDSVWLQIITVGENLFAFAIGINYAVISSKNITNGTDYDYLFCYIFGFMITCLIIAIFIAIEWIVWELIRYKRYRTLAKKEVILKCCYFKDKEEYTSFKDKNKDKHTSLFSQRDFNFKEYDYFVINNDLFSVRNNRKLCTVTNTLILDKKFSYLEEENETNEYQYIVNNSQIKKDEFAEFNIIEYTLRAKEHNFSFINIYYSSLIGEKKYSLFK